MTRLAVVSDTHFSGANPAADHNWEVVLDHLATTRPDLVLHGGDISAAGVDVPADLDHARAQLDRIPVPWRAVPGNHDLGDPEPEWAITRQRRLRYEDVVGDRFWASDLDGWRLVGLDAQALKSDHPEDEPRWQWMAEELGTGRPTLVILHRPIAPTAPTEPDVRRRYLNEPQRSRLRQMLVEAGTVQAVVTGHAHQWRTQVVDGAHWLWAPSAWARLADHLQPEIGQKVVGLIEIELSPTGLAGLDGATLVCPPGLVQHVHTRTREAISSA